MCSGFCPILGANITWISLLSFKVIQNSYGFLETEALLTPQCTKSKDACFSIECQSESDLIFSWFKFTIIQLSIISWKFPKKLFPHTKWTTHLLELPSIKKQLNWSHNNTTKWKANKLYLLHLSELSEDETATPSL